MSAAEPKVIPADVAVSQEARGGGPMILLLWISVTIALYVVSTGPIVKLAKSGHIPDSIGIIYAPLSKVCDLFPPADRFFRWYIEKLWRVD